jgi:quinol monooxygenase YgiN
VLVAEAGHQLIRHAFVTLTSGYSSWDSGERQAQLETLSVARPMRGQAIGARLLAAVAIALPGRESKASRSERLARTTERIDSTSATASKGRRSCSSAQQRQPTPGRNTKPCLSQERRQWMLIVAGHLSVRPEDRDPWVEAHREILKIARSTPGCIDLFVCADPADEGRVNIVELWESEEALEAWRAAADPPPKPQILSADVAKYQISSSEAPF